MTIRLNPHSEQLIQDQLAKGGFRSPEEVVERALEGMASNEAGARPLVSGRVPSQEELEAFLDAMAVYSDRIPHVAGETFSREMIYQDHP